MKQDSYVYFIKPAGMDGPIKIGCSQKPQSRLLALSIWSPFALEIIGTAPGDFQDEGRLHRRFSDLHTHGEWFLSSPLLRQTIERILEGLSIEDACKDIESKNSIRNQRRPDRTPDRELFLKYGHEVRRAAQRATTPAGYINIPDDIWDVLRRWRMDRARGHLPVVPTPEQFSRMDEFIADPVKHGVLNKWHRANKSDVAVGASA